jgi:hypothetical protein
MIYLNFIEHILAVICFIHQTNSSIWPVKRFYNLLELDRKDIYQSMPSSLD